MMKDSVESSVLEVEPKADNTSTHTGWLEKHAELIAKLEAEFKTPTNAKKVTSDDRYFGFKVGSLNILISATMSSEILEDNHIYSIPLAPYWLLGACNHRGDIVPVIDLEQIISGEKAVIKIDDYKTLVINKGENAIGFQLAKLPSPISFKKKERLNNISKLPSLVQPFVTAAYIKGRRVWVCIDFPSFIASFTN